VAARGELLAKIGTRHLVDPYLICATQHCQVYKGAGQEHPRTTRAVKATRGVVLVRPDGRLMDAVYSANAGGFTEHNDYAWPVEADPHLRGHLDAAPRTPGLKQFRGGITEDNIEAWLTTRPATWSSQTRYNRDKYRWTQTITARGMTRMVRDLKVGRVRALKVLERGVSGRATLIEIKGTRGDRRVRGELTIRRQLGDLRSSMFIVRTTDSDGDGLPDHFVLRGGGWGHGVGMCQTGAIGMAEAGKSYKQILLHYYQGAQLSPLY
jgi:SpoIID/LytB domain protein